MEIKAAVFYEKGQPFQIETLTLAPPQVGEVLVKVGAAGICHSDWHLMTGATTHPLPVVPGHEGAGVVEAVGPGVTAVAPGDHVALNWAPNCGACFYFSALACFAEYTVVPQECCVPLVKEVPLEIAALIGCAVTTGVGAVLNTADVEPGSHVVIYGAGGVGLNIIMGAKLAGASRIIAVDTHEAKGDMALSFGATDAIMAGPDTVAAIQRLTNGRGADYVFEAIGLPAVQEACLQAVRPGIFRNMLNFINRVSLIWIA